MFDKKNWEVISMKRLKKYFLFLCAAVLMLALSGCGTHKVDIEPYLSVRYRGNNGEAAARPELDWVELEYEIMSTWKEKDQTWARLSDLMELEDTIQCDPETIEGLSNGDKFTVKVTYNEKIAKKLGCKFKNLKKTFKVEGLKDAVVIDPFDESVFGLGKPVDVHFEGISPFLSVYILNHADKTTPYAGVSYQVDAAEPLANGDQVTVTASADRRLTQEGYVLSRTEITLDVGGFDSYLTDVSLLNHEDVAWIQGELEDNLGTQMRRGTPLYLSDPKEKFCIVGESAGSTWSQPVFQDHGYVTTTWVLWKNQYVLLVPFTVDIQDTQRFWWEGTYYEDGIVVPFPEACGYFVIGDLVLDPSGCIDRDRMSIARMRLFIDQEQMDHDILDTYGRLTPQNFH